MLWGAVLALHSPSFVTLYISNLNKPLTQCVVNIMGNLCLRLWHVLAMKTGHHDSGAQ
jgi:hypothetical protein